MIFFNYQLNSRYINGFFYTGELSSATGDLSQKSDEIYYVCGIGVICGIKETVKVIELATNTARLHLSGRFLEKTVESEVKKYFGWQKVDEEGWLDCKDVMNI